MTEEKEQPRPDDVLTSEQAAAVVGISTRRMSHLIADGVIDGVQREHAGRAGHRILRKSVLDWVARGMPSKKPAPKKTRARRKAAKVRA